MLRKLLLSALLASGTLTGLTLTPGPADAHPPFERHRHDRDGRHGRRTRFEVLYRHRDHWDSYGTYRDRDDAERAAWRLRHRGYQARIARERGW